MELFMKEKDMPKYCYDCPCHEAEHGICNLNGNDIFEKRPNDCPLKSFEAHDKENEILWKVYSDDPEIECWAEEYLNKIKQSNEYKEYVKFIDLQLEPEFEKDKRIAELEKENEQLKEIVEFRNTGRASGKSVTEKVLHFNDLQKENEQLKAELAELKNNAIVPKLKIGDTVYVIRKLVKDVKCGKIKSIWQGSHIDNYTRFRIFIKGSNSVTRQQCDLYTTQAEAEQALAKIKGEKL